MGYHQLGGCAGSSWLIRGALGDAVSKSTSGATVLLLLFPIIFVISVAKLCTRIVFLNFLPKLFELIRIFAYFTDGSFCELVS